mmetsp:Transcript_81566/g.205236  ORF Transcript_81566/g.205236 Transcript_81566/m.205236 type:complete len:321 (-) Transcript_81566:206-1168(-)|eukprot:CAMPEP_0115220100 /NCGR_PEP_ID=MMETSP0270-20121206/27270_1 /TAXON_ID=71861 /ORGANISM="Scrippsiella trochoidea, Strain CCMP3099" /LENGTH=320 /DNA_ID=CAMNT_0002634139 /DNA_START=85 /DNA_END=1047 /DNA_ORIENTATION=-
MGCCGSKLANKDQREFICKKMSKEMMLQSVPAVLKQSDEIKIPLPPAFDNMKNAHAKLLELADESTKKPEEAKTTEETQENGDGEAAANAPDEQGEKKKENVFEKGIGMFGKGIQKASDMVAGAVGEGAAAGFKLAASALDAPISSVESRLSTVAKEMLKSEEVVKKVSKVFSSHIVTAAVDGAEEKCQGVPNNRAVSDYLINKSKQHLVTQLKSEIGDAIKASSGIQAWDDAINTYNSATETLKKANVEIQPIQLDIKEYICQCTVDSLADMMGKYEENLRQNLDHIPNSVDHPDVFAKAFSDTSSLLKAEYIKLGGLE